MCVVVRRLEAQEVPSKQAEAITSAITEVLNDSLENVADTFVSKADMQKVRNLIFCNILSSSIFRLRTIHLTILYEIDKLTTAEIGIISIVRSLLQNGLGCCKTM
ncbi:unnamed protein product [Lactuca saligna]|uniref:Uncharacterized protein n=1 Tax=Lactuca saligna TaxID=75948 RepID=A0AA36DXU1_LACSI|nr:unnamed protein product [Lactuca saligna]